MRIVQMLFSLAVVCLAGCAMRCKYPKEQSYEVAMQILRNPEPVCIHNQIEACEDVDALRIIVFTASAAAWPMEAGPNVDFDTKLDGVFQSAMHRLFAINTDAANDAIELYKRAFPPDGAYALFFEEWEEERTRGNVMQQTEAVGKKDASK